MCAQEVSLIWENYWIFNLQTEWDKICIKNLRDCAPLLNKQMSAATYLRPVSNQSIPCWIWIFALQIIHVIYCFPRNISLYINWFSKCWAQNVPGMKSGFSQDVRSINSQASYTNSCKFCLLVSRLQSLGFNTIFPRIHNLNQGSPV